jgi:serine/threonine-protein kinase RsbW
MRKAAPTGESSEHTFRFSCDREAAVAARAALRDIDSEIPEPVMSDVMICVTELVTNSVQHPAQRADDRVELALRVSPDAVRVEVGDSGEGFEPGSVPRKRDERGGFGLHIVELLADRWGVERDELTRVWFEIDLGGSGAPG